MTTKTRKRPSKAKAAAPKYQAKRYRKQPVEIAAMHYDGTPECRDAIVEWTKGSDTDAWVSATSQLLINTLEGAMTVRPQAFVVRGIAGEHYAVAPDIFRETYAEVAA